MAVVRPILDKIVVQVQKSEKSMSGGIILAGGAKEQPLTAHVLARGPGGLIDGREVKMYINEGDDVLIPAHSGTKFTMDGQEYIIIPQSEVLAIVS